MNSLLRCVAFYRLSAMYLGAVLAQCAVLVRWITQGTAFTLLGVLLVALLLKSLLTEVQHLSVRLDQTQRLLERVDQVVEHQPVIDLRTHREGIR